MHSGIAYAVGTLLCWVGIGEVLIAVYRLAQSIVPPRGTDPRDARKRSLTSAVIAAASLLVSIPLLRGHEGGTVFVPVIWLVMPFAGWLGVVTGGIAVFKVLKLPFAGRSEQASLAKSAAGYAVLCALGAWFFRRDPSNVISLLRGVIPLTITSAGAILALALAATLAMALSAAFAKTRGVSKAVVTQLALLVGSVVFGLPFAWLVITSLKEDEDMSSPNGIVWVPKVTEQVPYMSKDNPLLEGSYNGQTIQANIITRNTDGTVLVNITKPGGVAGRSFTAPLSSFKEVPKMVNLVWSTYQGQQVKALVADNLPDGKDLLRILSPSSLKDTEFKALPSESEKIRHVGLK
ncbi:MAG TPA: hypothetical protein VKT78_17095, partial [Fimbriimonadaceae bacterium]|nr:hypothetical protein [Fimbriimonadaceae bacterium]